MNARAQCMMNRARGIAILAALVGTAGSAFAAGAIAAARPGFLSLRSGDVAIASLPNFLNGTAFAPGSSYILTLNQPMTGVRQQALEARGVIIHGYYPTWSYLVSLDAVSPASLRELDCVSSVMPFQNSWRLDSTIGTRNFATPERQAIAASGQVALRVLLFPGERLDGAAAAGLAAIPGLVVQGSESIRDAISLTMTLPAQSVPALSGIAAIQYAEELPEYTQRDANQRWIVQSNVLNSTPLYNRGINGTGQIVGVIDGYMAYQHCAFLDTAHPFGPTHRKIVAYNAALGNYDLHGTHVSGIIAGDSGAENGSRGVAYGAKIAFNIHPFGTEASFLDRFNLHYSQGARVNTNSWGNDGTTQYDYACHALDTFMRDHEDASIIFAVTNSTTVRNPENAKSVLSVTRTGNYPNQDEICLVNGQLPGAGPTSDGRRKPDIAAPGCDIASSALSSGCLTSQLSGTSMAAPAVGGIATLMRQYFMSGFYPTGSAVSANALVPTGALLKAMIVNSGVDVNGNAPGYPSDQEGWGRVLADGVLFFAGDGQHLIIKDISNSSGSALTTDQVREYRINVNNASQILRVTMAFTDQPATLPTSVAPVNDLDLIAISPNGTVFLGNNLVSGFTIPGGLPDPINSVEQLRINTPTPGTWTIRVRGTAINLGTQGFALSMTGDISEGACRGDFNQDGIVDFFDYLDFVNAFSAGNASADFNHDGTIDFFDYLDFLDAFNTPC